MTKQEFLNNFYILFDQVNDLAAPGYSPLELSLISSKVQEDLVVTTYNPKSNKLQEGFEETEKRVQDLGELVRYKNFTSFPTGFLDNSVEVVLPNTLITSGPTDFSDVYWFTVFEDCTSNVLDCTIANNTTKYVHPKIVDTSNAELINSQLDPFRKPYVEGKKGKVLRIRTEGRKHLLITDGTFSITKYTVGYIIKPTPIDLTTSLTSQVSQLSDSKHRELLTKTVEECLRLTKQFTELQVENSIPKE